MIRIALRMLVGDTTKWLGVVLGVFLCTFMITHMTAMFNGMMVRSYALVSDVPQAHVWVMDPAVEYIDEPAPLPSTALERVRSVAGVASAAPLFTGSVRARLPSGIFRSVLLVGVDDATLLGAPADMRRGGVLDLRQDAGAIVDTASAETLLRVPVRRAERLPGWHLPDFTGETRPLEVGDELLLNDSRVVVVGLADLGIRFLTKPVVYTTYSRATTIAPRQRNLLSFVLARAAEGEDHAALARRIEERTGLRARTSREFQLDTYVYYVRTMGVVERIVFLIAIGAVVGVCVSALLLYLFTAENARYYAVLLALGTSRAALVRMVVVQAVASGATGYGAGIGASALMGTLVTSDAMPYRLMAWNMGLTACMVVVVSAVAAALSAARLLRLEPGMVFKG
jgi:putative ABC transport system permease protein